MKKFRYFSILTLMLIAFLLCSSCALSPYESVTDVTKYADIFNLGIFTEESSLVSENEKYLLYWDNSTKNVIFAEKATGRIWSTSPIDLNTGTVASDETNVFSVLNLTYIIRSAFTTQDLTGKIGAVNEGNVTCKFINNGLEITLLFDEVSISIPVCFELVDNGLKVYVELERIGENADATGFRTFSIQLVPYLCSVNNSSDNYLFVPSGSGALMYSDERGTGEGREFRGRVYGDDAIEGKQEKYTNETQIRIPAFSATENGNTLCAVIDEGAELCNIIARAGNADVGYSNIFAEFQIRGLNETVQDYGGATGKGTYKYYAYDRIADGRVSILFTPVSSDKPGYVSLANIYKNYIENKYGLLKESEDNIVSLILNGGIQINKHIFGIPYKTVEALTTFNQSVEIIKDISEKTKVNNIDVQLIGYGVNGLQIGMLGGGFEFSKSLGSANDLKNFKIYCDENEINLYFDYDLIFFNKSGNGFSPSKNNASTANGFPAKVYSFSPATSDILKDNKAASVLSRDKISEAVDKAISSCKKMGFNAISISSLTNTVYSDFSNEKYTNGRYMADDITKQINKIKTNSLMVASNSANDYAATLSNFIFNTPTYSAKYSSLDVDVPFYQIVYKGIIPFSTESINLADNRDEQYLKTIECGGSLQFTLISEYTTEYASYLNKDIHNSVYTNNSEQIKKMVLQAKEFLDTIKGKEIVNHLIINNNVRKTVFENNVTVYVNYGNEVYSDGSISVEPTSFTVVK